MISIGMGECHTPLPVKAGGGGNGIPHGKYLGDEYGNVRFVEVVELTDECIERIADAVVRKMKEVTK